MPREHWTAGSATHSRQGFPGCERQPCFHAGKTGLTIDPCSGPTRSRATSGARSRRLNAMGRRCAAGIGGSANRVAGCVDGPATGDRSRERERR